MNFRINRYSAAALRSSLVAVTVAGSLLLASCGGGSGSTYVPTRLIVFGDEFSVLTQPSTAYALDAKKYSINGFIPGSSPLAPDCYSNPLWIQSIADRFGLVFAECNDYELPPTAFIKARAGAKVVDVVEQIDDFLESSEGTLVKSDLVTVMVGTNDVIELFERVRSSGPDHLEPDAAVLLAEERGRLLAAQFDKLTNESNTKARALYVLIPNVGDSPYGYEQEVLVPGSRALLRRLTFQQKGDKFEGFNDAIRSTIKVNGRSRGQVNADSGFQNYVDNPGTLNVKDAACLAGTPILDCTTSTLQLTANETTWLWAKGGYFGPLGHALLASGAFYIINNNPF
jgi:hypothetical protein